MDEKVKVARIGNRYHARYYVDGRLISEYMCNFQCDIGIMCREMLRWADKTGKSTLFTKAARQRANEDYEKIRGKIVKVF